VSLFDRGYENPEAEEIKVTQFAMQKHKSTNLAVDYQKRLERDSLTLLRIAKPNRSRDSESTSEELTMFFAK